MTRIDGHCQKPGRGKERFSPTDVKVTQRLLHSHGGASPGVIRTARGWRGVILSLHIATLNFLTVS